MKKLFSLLAAVIFSLYLLTSGCSSDSNSPTGDDAGDGGGGGSGGVTWQIGQQQGQQGIIFTGKPSVAVTVTQVTISLPAQNFNDPVEVAGATVFQPGQFYQIKEYTGIASGQQWTFKFQGKIGTDQGQAYDVTSNYTVP